MALTHDRDNCDPKPIPGDGPAAKTFGSVADTLLGARKEHGQDLRAVAQVLRIRYEYLEAIEAGEFERLPGTTYAHGFLRTYAEFLGLDGDEIVERFKQEMHGTESKPELVFPEPVAETRIPSGAIILISAVLLALAYGGWIYVSGQGKNVADLIPPLPDSLQAMLAGEAETALESASADKPAGSEQAPAYTPPETESATPSALANPVAARKEPAEEPAEEPAPDPGVASAPATAAPADFESDPATAARPETETTQTPADSAPTPTAYPRSDRDESAAAPTPEPAAPARQTTAITVPDSSELLTGTLGSTAATALLVEETVVIPAPPPAPQSMISTDRSPRVYGESTEGARIVLRALQDSWVQVRDRHDALLLTRVLRAGDTYFVPAQEGLTLLTGNAGGLEIQVDGVPVPPIGPPGTVRRQIALDPARLLSGTASPQ